MIALNTKTVGFAGIGVLILTALASDQIRAALLAAIQQHDPQTILSCIGVIAAFVLAYYGMPHSVPTATAPAANTPQQGS